MRTKKKKSSFSSDKIFHSLMLACISTECTQSRSWRRFLGIQRCTHVQWKTAYSRPQYVHKPSEDSRRYRPPPHRFVGKEARTGTLWKTGTLNPQLYSSLCEDANHVLTPYVYTASKRRTVALQRSALSLYLSKPPDFKGPESDMCQSGQNRQEIRCTAS